MAANLTTTHKCPITECVERVRHIYLMCYRHWRMVPSDLQREIWSEHTRNDRTIYNRAVSAAIKHVEEIESRSTSKGKSL